VVGRCSDPHLEASIRQDAADDARVRLFLKPVPHAEVQLYFAAADVVVLPYKNILNSGAALLAVSLGRPVCVPALGSLMELQQKLGDEWIHTYSGEFGPAVLRNAMDWSRSPRPAQACLDGFDWDNIGAATVAAYRAVIGNGRVVAMPSAAQEP